MSEVLKKRLDSRCVQNEVSPAKTSRMKLTYECGENIGSSFFLPRSTAVRARLSRESPALQQITACVEISSLFRPAVAICASVALNGNLEQRKSSFVRIADLFTEVQNDLLCVLSMAKRSHCQPRGIARGVLYTKLTLQILKQMLFCRSSQLDQLNF